MQLDAGEEVCPVCGEYRDVGWTDATWSLHTALCASLQDDAEETDDAR